LRIAVTQKLQDVIFSSAEQGCESERRVHCNEQRGKSQTMTSGKRFFGFFFIFEKDTCREGETNSKKI